MEEQVKQTAGTLLYRFKRKKSRKRVHCFAGPSPDDADPSCTSWEVDRAEFVIIEDAKKIIHPDQFPLLKRLEELLNDERPRKSKK